MRETLGVLLGFLSGSRTWLSDFRNRAEGTGERSSGKLYGFPSGDL